MLVNLHLFLVLLLLLPNVALASEWYSFRYLGDEVLESTGICVTTVTPSKLLKNGCSMISESVETRNNGWKGKKSKNIDCDGILVVFADDKSFCELLVNTAQNHSDNEQPKSGDKSYRVDFKKTTSVSTDYYLICGRDARGNGTVVNFYRGKYYANGWVLGSGPYDSFDKAAQIACGVY